MSKLMEPMDATQTQRASCRFKAVADTDGKPVIKLELFHQTVPLLASMDLEFELLSGTTLAQARQLADAINERILSVVAKPQA